MTPLMPDVDGLLTDALRAYIPGVTVAVLWPTDWEAALPLVVAHQVPGGFADPRGVALVSVDLQSAAGTRREASELARRARASLADACTARFSNGDGYLGAFRDISGLPTELRASPLAGIEPADDPHVFFRYQGTYQLTVRPVVR